jgi:hypothetical protein
VITTVCAYSSVKNQKLNHKRTALIHIEEEEEENIIECRDGNSCVR